MKNEYLQKTQFDASMLPDFTRGRHYKYSVYQQIINAFNLQFDQLDKALWRQSRNRFVDTFLNDTLDVINSFGVADAFTAPSSYTADGKAIPRSDKKDYESWWYDEYPTGCSLESYAVIPADFYNNTIGLAGGVVASSVTTMFEPLNILVRLEASGNNSQFVYTAADGSITGSVVTVYGKNSTHEEIHEDFVFFTPASFFSINKFTQITRIEYTTHCNGLALLVTVDASTMVARDFQMRIITSDRQQKTIYWEVENDILLQKTALTEDPSLYNAGIKDYEVQNSYKLIDTNGDPITGITSLFPSFNDSVLYVKTPTVLYCFSKNEAYPSLKEMSAKRTNDPLVIIIPRLVSAGRIDFSAEYNFSHVNKGKINKYSLTVSVNNTTYYYNGSTFILRPSDYTNTEQMYAIHGTYSFKNSDYTFDIGGLFNTPCLVTLTVRTDTGDSYTDTYLYDEQFKQALWEVPVAGNIIATQDNEILSITGNNLSKIVLHYDTYYYAESMNRVVFRETYTTWPIEFAGQMASVNNVFNELDQYGALVSLPRLLGERNASYKKRLQSAFKDFGGSTEGGLLQSISRELNILPQLAFMYTPVNGDTIEIKNAHIYFNNDTAVHMWNNDYGTISAYFTAKSLGSNVINCGGKDLKTLLPYSQIKNMRLSPVVSSVISFAIEPDYALVPLSVRIEGYEETANINNLTDAHTKKFFVEIDGSICSLIFNEQSPSVSLVAYQIKATTIKLYSSDIILYPLSDDLDSHFNNGDYSPYLKNAINLYLGQHPMTWSA